MVPPQLCHIENMDGAATHLNQSFFGKFVQYPGKMLAGDVEPRSKHALARGQLDVKLQGRPVLLVRIPDRPSPA